MNLRTDTRDVEHSWEWRALRVCGCAALVAMLSFLPPAVKAALHTRGVLHPWIHGLTFGLLAAVFVGSATTPRRRLALFFAALAIGCGVEFAQALVYQYPLERLDIVSDSLGVLLGGALRLLAPARSRLAAAAGLGDGDAGADIAV